LKALSIYIRQKTQVFRLKIFWNILLFEIYFLSLETTLLHKDKELQKGIIDEARTMLEEIFNEVLDSSDFDYKTQAQILSRIKPDGW
jgi:hypothetical protein